MTDLPRHHYSDPAEPGTGPTVVPYDLYASPPPWDINRPQPAFAALAAAGDIRGRIDILDAATIEVTTDPTGIPAWHLAVTRI